jgi:hypothetical protein
MSHGWLRRPQPPQRLLTLPQRFPLDVSRPRVARLGIPERIQNRLFGGSAVRKSAVHSAPTEESSADAPRRENRRNCGPKGQVENDKSNLVIDQIVNSGSRRRQFHLAIQPAGTIVDNQRPAPSDLPSKSAARGIALVIVRIVHEGRPGTRGRCRGILDLIELLPERPKLFLLMALKVILIALRVSLGNDVRIVGVGKSPQVPPVQIEIGGDRGAPWRPIPAKRSLGGTRGGKCYRCQQR